jgi:hypothetical protein
MRRVAVLQPEDLSCDIRRNVLDVGRLDDLAVLLAEDLDRVVVVADGALVERALDTDASASNRRVHRRAYYGAAAAAGAVAAGTYYNYARRVRLFSLSALLLAIWSPIS